MNKEQLQARLEELERENAALRAAHWLLANEEAFISPEDGAIFFVMPEVSRSNQCRYSLNMNDVFALACADAEPFELELAPKLKEIAEKEGWPGLLRWASEHRDELPVRPERMEPMPRAQLFCEQLEELCNRHGVLLVGDAVANKIELELFDHEGSEWVSCMVEDEGLPVLQMKMKK
jgi:hypothetical protein